MTRLYALSIVAFAMLAVVAGCGGDPGDQPSGVTDGTFAGTVTIGPLCPAEPCDPPADTPYTVRDLVLQRSGGFRFEISLDADGGFSAEVPEGTYTVHLTNCSYVWCATAFPQPGTPGAEPVTVTIIAGQTTTSAFDIDTGIGVGSGIGVEGLAQRLRDIGSNVEIGSSADQAFFAVPGQVLVVDGGDVQVYVYGSAEQAAADTVKVSPDGFKIGQMSVLWAEPPHFFQDGPLVALYVGTDAAVIDALDWTMGHQFAGR